VLIANAHRCHLSPQRATCAYHNAFGDEEIKKLTIQKCCSLFLKSLICFIHMKLKENIECVTKSDVDCIFKVEESHPRVAAEIKKNAIIVREIFGKLARLIIRENFGDLIAVVGNSLV
jgi:hypothetical protein